MSEVELFPGRVSLLGLGTIPHADIASHSGRSATLLDSALACAVQTLLEKGEAYTTAEFKVNLIRPITPRTGEVVCEDRVVHKGRTLAVSEATLKDSDGKLLAFGTETCSIFPVANLAAR